MKWSKPLRPKVIHEDVIDGARDGYLVQISHLFLPNSCPKRWDVKKYIECQQTMQLIYGTKDGDKYTY